MNTEIGTLYIVATPIGNLEDITLRALRILKEVDFILCEDTRTTGKLLSKYEIKNKTMSYHAHSTKNKENHIIELLKEGKNLALVSDAGTPCISDPGVMLVNNVYEEFKDKARIVPIPGASALISAISACGISTANFTFLGFLPHKKGRETIFAKISESEYASVFYESTHRLLKTLSSLEKILDEDRTVVVAREITKKFEEIKRGSISNLLNFFTDNTQKQKGEFVIIVDKK